MRWFDGVAWTEHVSPVQLAPQQPTPEQAASQQSAWQQPASWQPAYAQASSHQPVAEEPATWHASQQASWQAGPQAYTQGGQQAPWNTTPPAPWHTAPQASWQTHAPVDNGPSTVNHWMLPVGRSWQSIVAGYLGLFALAIWPLGPVAIGFGVWALVRAQKGGHGRGRAITGILGGAVGVAVLVGFALNS